MPPLSPKAARERGRNTLQIPSLLGKKLSCATRGQQAPATKRSPPPLPAQANRVAQRLLPQQCPAHLPGCEGVGCHWGLPVQEGHTLQLDVHVVQSLQQEPNHQEKPDEVPRGTVR